VSDRRGDFHDFAVASERRLVGMAYGLTGDWADAEDLVQDVYERLYVAWPRIDDPHAYARRALINRSRSRWRRRSRHREVPLDERHDRSVGEFAGTNAERDSLDRALALLPPRQRAVVVLRFIEDLSEADTARLLECSTGTVKSQTARALARLRKLIPSGDDCAADASLDRSLT
jgi:RNA polymerase sigma-70 factor (sigma-E family)